MKKQLCAILSCAAIAVLGCGCAKTDAVRGQEFYAMNSVATLVIHDDFSVRENIDRFNSFAAEAGRLINEIENSVSATRKNSYIYKFNQAEAGERVELDRHAFNVLSVAQSVYIQTDGYYNPAVYYNVQSYGFFAGDSDYPHSIEDLPAEDEIQAYMYLYSHFSEIELCEDENRYYVIKPEYTVEYGGKTLSMKLDLGGIGKGYAADCINNLMDDYGYTEGYFNFGYSSIAFKQYKGGKSYNLSFSNPRSSSNIYAQAPVKDACISTSGDYEDYFIINDGGVETRYCHVFNPKTGKPVKTGIMSATVIGGSAAENDAFTTAIMAMGLKNAVAFIEEYLSDRKVIFTYDGGADGYFYYTNMAGGEYTITSNDFSPLTAGAEDVA